MGLFFIFPLKNLTQYNLCRYSICNNCNVNQNILAPLLVLKYSFKRQNVRNYINMYT